MRTTVLIKLIAGLLGLAVALGLGLWSRLSTYGRVLLIASLVIGGGVGVFVGATAGDVPSSAFLGIAAFSMVLVIGLLVRAARSLAEEAPAEVAVAVGRRKKELEREKASLLKALKELEFDHEMGKVSEVDFREIGGQYRARAMRVLRQLDEQGADYKSLVEKELKARLGVKKDDDKKDESETAEKNADEKKSADSKDARKIVETKIHRCESCGTSNDADAVFCKKCGKKVAA